MTPSQQRTLVTVLIGLGVLIVAFFGIRTVSAFKEFRGHRPPHPFDKEKQPETDVELIRDWMTIPFIGKMYHVPPPKIFDALDIPMNGNQEKSLKQLNEEYFPDAQGFIVTEVKAALLENMPPPLPTVPVTPTLPTTP